MATINHPGVVDVYDYGNESGTAFLVMEYIEGDALSRTLSRVGRLTPARTMALMAQAADALHAAHEKGIVHRDVKPGNLLVRPNGTLVLTDFGIARSAAVGQLTAAGSVLGTASYISPEQAVRRRAPRRCPTCTRSAWSPTSACPAGARSRGRTRSRSPCGTSGTRRRRCRRTSRRRPVRSSRPRWRRTRPRATRAPPPSARSRAARPANSPPRAPPPARPCRRAACPGRRWRTGSPVAAPGSPVGAPVSGPAGMPMSGPPGPVSGPAAVQSGVRRARRGLPGGSGVGSARRVGTSPVRRPAAPPVRGYQPAVRRPAVRADASRRRRRRGAVRRRAPSRPGGPVVRSPGRHPGHAGRPG